MRAGKLRHRVTIQRKTGGRDADGGIGSGGGGGGAGTTGGLGGRGGVGMVLLAFS
jgi:hypothetical protein